MAFRGIRRSSPSPRWRTLSSTGFKTTERRKSFEREQFSDISHLRYGERQSTNRPPYFPGVSRRSNFQFSTSSEDYRPRDHPSIVSRNLKTASKPCWKYPQYNATQTFLPRKRYSLASKNVGGNNPDLRGMKRLHSHDDLSDSFPAKRPKQWLGQRYGTGHYSRSPQQDDPSDHWNSQSCRRSKETYQPVSHNNEYGKMSSSRDLPTNLRESNKNSKGLGTEQYRRTSNYHADQEQCSSWKRQFPGDAKGDRYDALNKSSSKVDMLSDPHPQRAKKESSLDSTPMHDDRGSSGHFSRDRGKITKDIQRSPLLCKQNSKEKIPLGKQDRYLQDRKQTVKSKHESLFEAKSRQEYGTNEPVSQGRYSKDSTKETKCSNIKSSNQSDMSWVIPNRRPISQSLSPVSDSSSRSSRGRSRDSNESRGSRRSNADAHGKAQVLEFNPDYVVIVRRRNEGERPLCMREEFSETGVKPAISHEQNSEKKDSHPPGKASALETTSLKSDDKSNQRVCDSSSTHRDSSAKFPKEKTIDAEINSDLDEKSSCDRSTTTSVSDVVSAESAKREDVKRIVMSDRISSVNKLSDMNQQSDLVPETGKEPSMSRKKNTFDLRQRIAERRLQRIGKVNIPKTVQRFPNRSKNLNESFSAVSSLGTSLNQNYTQKQIFSRQSFFRQKAEPRRSVILRQSL